MNVSQSNLPPLTAEEKAWVDRHRGAAASAAIRWRCPEGHRLPLDRDERISIAHEALCYAARRYKASLGRPSTYISRCVICNLIRASNDNSVIHVPLHLHDRNNPESRRRYRAAACRAGLVHSIDREMAGGDPYRDRLRDRRALNLDAVLDLRDRIAALHRAIDRLPAVLIEPIRGKLQGEGSTAIGDRLGISHQAVRDRQKRAIRLIRQYMIDAGITPEEST